MEALPAVGRLVVARWRTPPRHRRYDGRRYFVELGRIDGRTILRIVGGIAWVL